MAEKWNWEQANPSKYHGASTNQTADYKNYCDYYMDEDNWERVYYPILFKADAAQVQAAYAALTGKGAAKNFNQRVWNDLADKIVDIQISDGQPRNRTWASTLKYSDAKTADERSFADRNFLEVKRYTSPYISSADKFYIDVDDHKNYGPRLYAYKFNLLVNALKSLPITWEWEWEKDGVIIEPGQKVMGKYILDLVRAINHYQAQSRLPFGTNLYIDDTLRLNMNRLQMDKSVILRPNSFNEDFSMVPDLWLGNSGFITFAGDVAALNIHPDWTTTDWAGLSMDWNTRFLFNGVENTVPVTVTKSQVIKVPSVLDKFEFILHELGYVPTFPISLPLNIKLAQELLGMEILSSSIISGYREDYNFNLNLTKTGSANSYIIKPYSDSFLWNFNQDINELALRNSCMIKVDNRMDSLYNIDVHQIAQPPSTKLFGTSSGTLRSTSYVDFAKALHMLGGAVFNLTAFGSISDQDYAVLMSKVRLAQLSDTASMRISRIASASADSSLSTLTGTVSTSTDDTAHMQGESLSAFDVLAELLKDETLNLSSDTIEVLRYAAEIHAQLFKYVTAQSVHSLLAEGYIANARQKEIDAALLVLYSSTGSLLVGNVIAQQGTGTFHALYEIAKLIVDNRLVLSSSVIHSITSVSELLAKNDIPISSDLGISFIGAGVIDSQLCAELDSTIINSIRTSSKLSQLDSAELRSSYVVSFCRLANLSANAGVDFEASNVERFVDRVQKLTVKQAQSSIASNTWIMLDTVSTAVVKHGVPIESAIKLAYSTLASVSIAKYQYITSTYKNYLNSLSKLQYERFIVLAGQMIDAMVSSALAALGLPTYATSTVVSAIIDSYANLKLQEKIMFNANLVLQRFVANSDLKKTLGARFSANGILELIPSASIELERSKEWRRPVWQFIQGKLGLNMYQFHTTHKQFDYTDRLRIDSMWHGYADSTLNIGHKVSGVIVSRRFATASADTIIDFRTNAVLYVPSRLWNVPYKHHQTILDVKQFHKITEFDTALYLDVNLQPVHSTFIANVISDGNIDTLSNK